ncbi:hypothetical protein Tco_0508574 [Tanacetum coccineum]
MRGKAERKERIKYSEGMNELEEQDKKKKDKEQKEALLISGRETQRIVITGRESLGHLPTNRVQDAKKSESILYQARQARRSSLVSIQAKRRQARVVKQETASKSRQARDGKQESINKVKECNELDKDKKRDKEQEGKKQILISEEQFLYKQERRACKSRSRQESARLAVVKAKRPASKESCPKQESASKKSRQGKKKTGGKQRKTNDSEGTGRNSRTKYSEGMHELEKTRRKTRAKEAISHLRSSAFVDYGVRILGPQNNTLPGYHDPLKSASWT